MALWHLSCFNSNQPADLPPRLNFSAPPTPLIRPPRPRSLTCPFTSTAHSLLYSITGVSTFITLWIPRSAFLLLYSKLPLAQAQSLFRSRHPPVFPDRLTAGCAPSNSRRLRLPPTSVLLCPAFAKPSGTGHHPQSVYDDIRRLAAPTALAFQSLRDHPVSSTASTLPCAISALGLIALETSQLQPPGGLCW
ncbi:hypothetical protein Forpe1208_v013034 [Fusarium oxysporum f. sp. rapae]|uniref:Uncharacterized protein n=1 Tax=Fusarium oxysporum f. sp. rapae TaxID=485398 RepID=A0A8J5U0K8_FUSOX|nr:hypothetical protein Forpe1208_v013034 [Fusarium oxysporum f. sp. rapae]